MTPQVKPGAQLSPMEWDVLWYASQGHTNRSTGRKLGISEGAAMATRQRVCGKLQAVNIAQAIHTAMTRGIIGTYQDCGSRAAYAGHIRRRESACMACRLANADYTNAQSKTVGQRFAKS